MAPQQSDASEAIQELVASDEPDMSFLRKFMAARERKLPINSNFYSFVEKYHAGKRLDQDRQFEKQYYQPLSAEVVGYYNEVFDEAARLIRTLSPSFKIPLEAISRANRITGFRLKPNATLKELLLTDTFGQLTYGIDIPIPEILRRDDLRSKKMIALRPNTLHYYFHRLQRTEHVFFHEICVGYLVNLCVNAGHIPKDRSNNLVASADYWHQSAYLLSQLAGLLKLRSDELVGLHLADEETIAKVLPLPVREVMLITSHMYWYLEQFHALSKAGTVSELLATFYKHFVLPCLYRVAQESDLQLREDAGEITDSVLCNDFLAACLNSKETPTQDQLIETLRRFTSELWEQSRKSRNNPDNLDAA